MSIADWSRFKNFTPEKTPKELWYRAIQKGIWASKKLPGGTLFALWSPETPLYSGLPPGPLPAIEPIREASIDDADRALAAPYLEDVTP